jgi:hypothetical protein
MTDYMTRYTDRMHIKIILHSLATDAFFILCCADVACIYKFAAWYQS